MTFKNHLKKYKTFTESKLLSDGFTYNFHPSFNYENKDINFKNIKYIIVGTFTPFEGRIRGYFYASPSNVKNFQIAMLCEVFKRKGYTKEADDLFRAYDPSKLKVDKKAIKKLLTKMGVAFLDVVKIGYSPDVSDYANDDYIYPFCLDYDFFKDVYNQNNKIIFICNSRSAEDALKNYIFKDYINKPIIKFAPQILKRKDSFNYRVNKLSDCLDI